VYIHTYDSPSLGECDVVDIVVGTSDRLHVIHTATIVENDILPLSAEFSERLYCKLDMLCVQNEVSASIVEPLIIFNEEPAVSHLTAFACFAAVFPLSVSRRL
jgi:hypothetical protein